MFSNKKGRNSKEETKKSCIVNILHVYSIFIFFFNWFDSLINLKDMANYIQVEIQRFCN